MNLFNVLLASGLALMAFGGLVANQTARIAVVVVCIVCFVLAALVAAGVVA